MIEALQSEEAESFHTHPTWPGFNSLAQSTTAEETASEQTLSLFMVRINADISTQTQSWHLFVVSAAGLLLGFCRKETRSLLMRRSHPVCSYKLIET